MIASLYAGISGLNANSTAMTVIGDNIANVGTTAFKGNRSHFANILSSSLGGDSVTGNVGRGVEFWGTNAQWTQGYWKIPPTRRISPSTAMGFSWSRTPVERTTTPAPAASPSTSKATS